MIDTPFSPFWIAACIAFVVAFLAIVSVRSIASHLSLVDKPGGRKIHDHEVPVVGGLGVFLGLFVAVNLLPLSARPDAQFVTICAIFVIVGLVDDRVGLSPWFRLLAQFGWRYGSHLTLTSVRDTSVISSAMNRSFCWIYQLRC